MLAGAGAAVILPPGFHQNPSNSPRSTVVSAGSRGDFIMVTRHTARDHSSVATSPNSAVAAEEFVGRHMGHMRADPLRTVHRGRWTSSGLDGASLRWAGPELPGPRYLGFVGCRGLRWTVFTVNADYLDAADAIARSLRELGTSTRA